jgi:hypothetical protein
VAGLLVAVLSLKLTDDRAPSDASQTVPAAGPTGGGEQAIPRSVARLTLPGTTFLPVSVIRTPVRARLLSLLGLVMVIAISSVVLTVLVVGGGRLFGRALEAYFGG